MSLPTFLLTKKVPIIMHRRGEGSYVDGEWVEGTLQDVTIQANVQPLKDYEIMMMPESERTRDWQKIYSAELIRSEIEGIHDADEFEWESALDGTLQRYKVMKVRRYKMGILDHWRGFAARIELTPN